jgi:hypothetical protein
MTTVNATVQLLATAAKALNAAREHATATNDTEMKLLINAAYDQMAALREAVGRVTEENDQLRSALDALEKAQAERPELRQFGDTNYYYVGSKGPFCQACYDKDGKLVGLLPPENWNRGVRRECPVCNDYFYEKRMDFRGARLRR